MTHEPVDADCAETLVAAVREAIEAGEPVEIRGAGSKRFYGEDVAGRPLDVTGHRGVVSYEPSEGRWVQQGIMWGFASALSLGISVVIRKKGLAAMPNVGLTVAWSNLVSFPILFSLRRVMPAARER